MEEYNQTGIYDGDIIRSALDGDPECCYKLGKLVGTPSSSLDIPKTPSGPEGMAYWFMKAADLGHTDAQVDYAMLCIEGMGVPVNYAMAMKYLHMAASGANPSSQAMTNIASLHSQGFGVPQDYLTAREWWLKAAERGSRQSMYALGIMYQNGRFGQPDQEEALKWLTMAGDNGHELAAVSLGYRYFLGRHGHSPDMERAAHWLVKAVNYNVENGADSPFFLGTLLFHGEVVNLDKPAAARLYALAAQRGNVYAAIELAKAMEKGDGINQNVQMAISIYKDLANRGLPDAYYYLGRLYLNGQYVSKDLVKSLTLLHIAADKGDHLQAMAALATMYDSSDDIDNDINKALYYYRLLAGHGHVFSCRRLGELYSGRRDITPNNAESLRYYKCAADLGDANSLHALGVMHFQGIIVQQDFTLCERYYRASAEKGFSQAMAGLGALYARGQGVPQDFTLSMHWYQRAFEAGDRFAAFGIGALHQAGHGVPVDATEAIHWYRIAAAAGHPMAIQLLSGTSMVSINQSFQDDRISAWNRIEEAISESVNPSRLH